MGTMQLKLALAGEKIVIAGLALQVATFIVFLVASIDFHIRMNRKTASSLADSTFSSWKKMLWILYSVSTLILLRCAFRLIEYSMGNAAYLTAHEWPCTYLLSAIVLITNISTNTVNLKGSADIFSTSLVYVFDMVPMFCVLVLLLVLQPTKYIAEENRKLSEGSMEERVA
jgi:hypothetical protein